MKPELSDPKAKGFDPERLSRIPAFIQDRYLASGKLPCALVLVGRDDDVVHFSVQGRARENGEQLAPDAIFRIASMTKPVTSVAALMLVEEGKIALSDPVTRWIPELDRLRVLRDPAGPLDENVPARRAITVDDLLTHRAGLAYAPFSEGPIQRAYQAALGDPGINRMTADEWLAALGTLPLAYQPGERFHYGHSTDVLGFLVGRVEGKPLRSVLRERIFAPLGMTDTDFWLPRDQRDRLASLYRYDEGAGKLVKVELEMYDEPPSYTPGGGGLISSAADYHRFARMLLLGGALDGVRLLRPETVELMRTNRLTAAQREVHFVGMPLWKKSGFGLGLAIAEDLVDNPYACGAAGSFTWPGVFGTWWQADPVNELVMIYLIQHQVAVSARSGSTLATGRGAAGRRALPVYQRGIYDALEDARGLADRIGQAHGR